MTNGNFDTLDGAPTMPGEPQGQILSGRYKIVRRLGSGGMGTVYLAKDMELDIDIAIKVLPTLLANNKRAVDNLRREAKTALTLSHPNIVRLHTFQSDEAIKYLVMEYIDGGSLEERVSAAGALSVDETIKIFTQVAAGLDYAHSQNVLHRDIKPANIMLTKDGVAKLADFGIARQIKESMTRITGKETSGTMLYMAPEQFRGGEPDHRSDIYSLAASIYECLSGKPPFWRGSIEYQILHEKPMSLGKLNDKQNATLIKALSKDPNGRQNNAKELFTDCGIDSSTLTWQPASSQKPRKETLDYSKTISTKLEKKKLKPKVAVVIGILALIVIATGFIVYHQQKTPKKFGKKPLARPLASTEKAHEAIKDIDDIKWSEARAAMGTLATAIRAYFAENNCAPTLTSPIIEDFSVLGLAPTDLDGRYFDNDCYSIDEAECVGGKVTFVISCDASKGKNGHPTNPLGLQLIGNGSDTKLVVIMNAQNRQPAMHTNEEKTKQEEDQSFHNLTDAAFICEAKDDWEKAIEGYKKALAIKDDTETKEKLAICQHNLYLKKAQSSEAESNLDGAIDNYTKALAYKQLASTQLKLDTAKKALEAKIEQQSKAKEYVKWLQQAQDSENQGDLPAAVKFYKRAQEYATDSPSLEFMAVVPENQAFTKNELQTKINSLNQQIVEKEKLDKFNQLLTSAKENDNKANGKEALKSLEQALALYPNDSTVIALKEKIEGYYTPKPGDTLTNSIGMVLTYIPRGDFLMGSPADEANRFNDEGPQHKVYISKSYYMGTTEVTKHEFYTFVSESSYRTTAENQGWAYTFTTSQGTSTGGKVNGANWLNPGFAQTNNDPVVCVSWNDAKAFCHWLSRKEGKNYRLPTEAEWEYACRAGTTEARYSNNMSNSGESWCNGADLTAKSRFPDWTVFNWHDGYIFTSPVQSFKANPWGLYDMYGNVWEWCEDWHSDYYYANSSEADPFGPSTGTSRVLRGGSWYKGFPENCRSADRAGISPESPTMHAGFRVVMETE